MLGPGNAQGDFLISPSVCSALERDAARQGFDVNMALLRASAFHVRSMASIALD